MRKKLIVVLLALTSFLVIGAGISACDCGGAPVERHTHEYSESITEPSCTARGYTTFTCGCGKSYVGDYTDPLGHDYDGDVCARCGYIRHDHVYEKTVIEPTCTEQGYTRGVCKICGATYTASFVDPLGHDYNNGRCTVCGTLKPTEGLEYTLSDDGAYYICSGIGTATEEEIIIASDYNGLSVTAIGKEAFLNNRKIKSLIIPDTVTSIGEKSFEYCTGLITVSIGDGVTSIGIEAFYCCDNVTDLTLGKSVVSIGENAFFDCKGLTSVVIPDGMIELGKWAFPRCENLQSVTLPDSLTTIGDYAFYKCSNLKSINIPDNVTYIGEDAFLWCDKIENIAMPARYLTSFKKYNMKTIVITSGDTIGESALNCPYLINITLPESLNSIGSNAFEKCYNLTDINFKGSMLQWEAVKKGTAWNSGTGLYVIHCSDGDIDKNNEYLRYTLSRDGSYYICFGIKENCAGTSEIVIPSAYNGKPVREIGERAFEDIKSVERISIPDSVTTIKGYAFYGCNNLTSLVIPDSVTTIANYAFCGCGGVKSITIPSGVRSLESYTFINCPRLEKIIFKGTIDQWKAIPHTDWLYLNRCTIECTDGSTNAVK